MEMAPAITLAKDYSHLLNDEEKALLLKITQIIKNRAAQQGL